MPSTHLTLHYHIVFSTKDRHPWIDPGWRDDLHRKRTFEAESLDLLKKHEIDYDERFLW